MQKSRFHVRTGIGKLLKNLFFLILVVSSLVSCSPSTQIEKSWREPGATVSVTPANKPLVIAMVKDTTKKQELL